MSSKNVFCPSHLYSKVLEAYNRLLEQTFEDKLLSEKDKKILQKIYQRLEEISVLIDDLKENTK